MADVYMEFAAEMVSIVNDTSDPVLKDRYEEMTAELVSLAKAAPS